MEGDLRAAAHFFSLAEGAIGDACATAEAVNLLPGDGVTRLREIAWRLADGAPEPTRGWAIEYRCAEDGAEISVWLTLGRVGPEAGALLTVRDAGAAGQ